MSGLSFRPRPIDISKPIPIIRADSVDYEEIIKLAVTVPKIATGMDPEDEEEKHIQEAIKRSLNAQANPSDYAIPTPNFRVVAEPDEPPFERKITYISYATPTQEELDAQIEYDLGDSDCEWLEEYNKELKVGRRLSEDGLEFMIDRMEKAFCYNNKSLSLAQAEKTLADDETRRVSPLHVAPVYKYWMKKRKGRKQPLLERFHEPPAFDDPSPLVAFRPREPFTKQQRKGGGNRKNDRMIYNKMTQLRREFERSRMLLEMIKKREKLKRDQIQLASDLFELRVRENIPYPDDPRDIERERELQRERERERASLKMSTDRESTKGPERKRRRRDSALATDRGRPPAHGSKRSKLIVKLTSGHVFPDGFKPTRDPIPDFMSFPSTTASSAARELEAQKLRIQKMLKEPPTMPYPMERDGRVFVGPALPPFRGRVRMGRGGRILFDRFPSRPYRDDRIDGAQENDHSNVQSNEANQIIASSPMQLDTTAHDRRNNDKEAEETQKTDPTSIQPQKDDVVNEASNGRFPVETKDQPTNQGENQEELPNLDEVVDLEFEVQQALATFQALENEGGLPPPDFLDSWLLESTQPSLPTATTTTTTTSTTTPLPTITVSEVPTNSSSGTESAASQPRPPHAQPSEDAFGKRLAHMFRKWRDEETDNAAQQTDRTVSKAPKPASSDDSEENDADAGLSAWPAPPVEDLVAKFQRSLLDGSVASKTTARAHQADNGGFSFSDEDSDDHEEAIEEEEDEEDDEDEEESDISSDSEEDSEPLPPQSMRPPPQKANGTSSASSSLSSSSASSSSRSSNGKAPRAGDGGHPSVVRLKSSRATPPLPDQHSHGTEMDEDEEDEPDAMEEEGNEEEEEGKREEDGGEEDEDDEEEEEEDGKESLPDVTDTKRKTTRPKRPRGDSLSNIWAPSLMT